MDRAAFDEAIKQLNMENFREELQQLAKPCLDFLTREATEPIPANRSKIGGMPDLPEGMEWPCTTNEAKIPLLFLGRICATDASKIFPEIRHDLLFFAEWIYAWSDGVVIALEPGTAVTPAECPPRPEDAAEPLVECEVTAVPGISLPTHFAKELYSAEILRFGETPHPYWGDRVMEIPLTDLIHLSENENDPPIRLGGYPIYSQRPPLEGSGVDPEGPEAKEWRSLMCFGDNDEARLVYMPTGFFGFLVREDEVAKGWPFRTICYKDM